MMTNEQREAFYAQYWGQKVGKCATIDHGRLFIVNENDMCCIDFLELRTINSLTSDEAIEVAKIANITSFKTANNWEAHNYPALGSICIISKQSHHDFLIDYELYVGNVTMYDGDDKSEITIDQREIIDYLRSIGVLVGFRQFTPEMLIAEGVVKIKE